MSTKRERQLQWERAKERLSSRVTHFQSGHIECFGEPAVAGQTLAGASDWEPTEDGSGWVPAVDNKDDPDNKNDGDLPGGTKKADDESEPQRARVNTTPTTRVPLVVSGDNRNVSKATTIDISELDNLPENQKETVLRLIRNNPRLISLTARNLEDRVKLTALQKLGKVNGPIEAAGLEDVGNKKDVLELGK